MQNPPGSRVLLVSPWPGLALTGALIVSCLGTEDEGLLYPLLQDTAGSGAERNLEGAGPGWVEPEWGGAQPPDSMWQPPAGSHPPPWVGCQSRPAGFPENSFPMSSAVLVGHPTHSREPLSRDPKSLHAPLLRALTFALTHTRKSMLSVLGSQELRQGLRFPSPHTLMGVFCFFQTLGDLLRHTKGA